MSEAHDQVAVHAARAEFSKLSAYLASRFGTLEDAEDALSSALMAALERWPASGVPDNPTAWLLAVARRKLADGARRRDLHARKEGDLKRLMDELDALSENASGLPDRRLGLLLACAHPAIDRSIQPALMLQTVLGLTAEQIGAAFLVSGNTMGQRLARAKAKIRATGLMFDVPDEGVLPERLGGVLNAIYALFTTGEAMSPIDQRSAPLRDEALFLARLVVSLAPDHAEALGLLALFLFVEARHQGDMASDPFIALSDQDPQSWSAEHIGDAEALLSRAAEAGAPGRFQTEAAIQSVHCQRAATGKTNWPAIIALYHALLRQAPSVGAAVSLSGALIANGQPVEALGQLDAIESKLVVDYAPYWAVKAEALVLSGDKADAADAFDRAMTLAIDPRHKAYLARRRASLMN